MNNAYGYTWEQGPQGVAVNFLDEDEHTSKKYQWMQSRHLRDDVVKLKWVMNH